MTAPLIAALTKRWMHFWFEPSAATNLGMCRLVFFGWVFLIYLREDFSAWGSVSHTFWMPLWMFRYTGVLPLDTDTLWALQIGWKISLLLSAVGLWCRISMAVAFITSTYLFAIPHNFGQTYHFDALLVFAMGVLVVSHARAAWSIDALIASYRDPGRAKPPDSGEFTWPVRLVWVTMALVFVGAGISKLRHGGFAWVLSDTMKTFLIRAHYGASDADPLVSWGLVLSQWSWGPRVLAATALGTEVLFPLALVSVTARRFLVPASFAMLLGIRALMGPTFGGFLAAYAFWVPWTALGQRVREWIPAARTIGVRRIAHPPYRTSQQKHYSCGPGA
jgi:hypothetical protein